MDNIELNRVGDANPANPADPADPTDPGNSKFGDYCDGYSTKPTKPANPNNVDIAIHFDDIELGIPGAPAGLTARGRFHSYHLLSNCGAGYRLVRESLGAGFQVICESLGAGFQVIRESLGTGFQVLSNSYFVWVLVFLAAALYVFYTWVNKA